MMSTSQPAQQASALSTTTMMQLRISAAGLVAALKAVHAVLSSTRQSQASPESALRDALMTLDAMSERAAVLLAASPASPPPQARSRPVHAEQRAEQARSTQLLSHAVGAGDRPAERARKHPVAYVLAQVRAQPAHWQAVRKHSPEASDRLARGLSASGRKFTGAHAPYSDPECTFQPNTHARHTPASTRHTSKCGIASTSGGTRPGVDAHSASAQKSPRSPHAVQPDGPATPPAQCGPHSACGVATPPARSPRSAQRTSDKFAQLHAGRSVTGRSTSRGTYLFCEEIPSFTPTIDAHSSRLASAHRSGARSLHDKNLLPDHPSPLQACATVSLQLRVRVPSGA